MAEKAFEVAGQHNGLEMKHLVCVTGVCLGSTQKFTNSSKDIISDLVKILRINKQNSYADRLEKSVIR